jgi:hypothetical protein
VHFTVVRLLQLNALHLLNGKESRKEKSQSRRKLIMLPCRDLQRLYCSAKWPLVVTDTAGAEGYRRPYDLPVSPYGALLSHGQSFSITKYGELSNSVGRFRAVRFAATDVRYINQHFRLPITLEMKISY